MQHTQVNEERLDDVVLAWLWCQRSKPAQLQDLEEAIGSMLYPESVAREAAGAVDRLCSRRHAERVEKRSRKGEPKFSLRIAPEGEARVAKFIGRTTPPSRDAFGVVRRAILPAVALNLAVSLPDKKSKEALVTLLAATVWLRHFGTMALRDGTASAQLTSAKLTLVKLALAKWNEVPLESIHLKALPAGLMPSLVVGPLFDIRSPAMDFDTLLKSSVCPILQITSPKEIATGVVRRWLHDREAVVPRAPVEDAVSVSSPLKDVDLPTFADHVLAAAADVARTGGPGVSNLRDKVLVNAAWRRYQERFGAVPLDRFKRRLSEANPEFVDLVREDLIPQDRALEFEDAEVRTGASSYHYIRVPHD